MICDELIYEELIKQVEYIMHNSYIEFMIRSTNKFLLFLSTGLPVPLEKLEKLGNGPFFKISLEKLEKLIFLLQDLLEKLDFHIFLFRIFSNHYHLFLIDHS